MQAWVRRCGTLILGAGLAGQAGASSFLAEALSSGAWSNSSVWSGSVVPANDTPAAGDQWGVTLDNAVSVSNDVSATIETLAFGEKGALAVILGGATGALSVAGSFDWKRGVLGPAGPASFTVLSGATASLTTSGFKFLRQRFVNQGATRIVQSNLAGNSDARLTNASGGTFTLEGGSGLTTTGLFRNETGATFASVAGSSPTAVVNQIAWVFDSEAGSTVDISTNTAFNGGGTHRGHYKVGPQATLQFGFVGTTNTFAPQTLEASALSLANLGSQVTIAQSTAVLPTIQNYQQTGGTTTFQRDVTINDAVLQSGAVLNATNSTARYEGNGALSGAQLGGANGTHTFSPGSNTTLTGNNVIDAKVVQHGFVTMNGGELFFAANGSWVVDVGGRFVIADKAGVRRSVQQGAGLGVFEVRNGALVVADLFDAEHDAAMHNLAYPADAGEIVVFSPLEPNLTGTLVPTRSAGGFAAQSVPGGVEGDAPAGVSKSSFAALSAPVPVDPAAILVNRGRLTITESMVGSFDVRVRNEGTFLVEVQPEGASRLIGNGKAGRASAADTLEWRGIIDALAPEGEESTLTIVSHLKLTDESLLEFDLGQRSDRLSVQGDLILDGTIEIRPDGEFGPGRYTLLEWTGTLDDRGIDLIAPDGTGFDLRVDIAAGRLDLVVAAVPEPHVFVMLLAGLALVSAQRRHRWRVLLYRRGS